MKQTLLVIFTATLFQQLPAQNLVINSDAESLPRGTGWNIVSQGPLTCVSVPTDNMVNWTLKPNGTANYPYDHTTGANGGTVFFSGCASYFEGPFELEQTIDISADAALIDLGNEAYSFSGYMQTPVSNQTDQGRFIVDYLDASNAILGTSYTSSWQSYFGGSGTGWINYSDTRIAPAGTRKIKIRLQTQMLLNQPAINVYFDDITLSKPVILPVNLLSFSGREYNGNNYLNWSVTNEVQLTQFELELSNDATNFSRIATIPAGKNSYQYIDDNNSFVNGRYFYRLRIKEADGTISYSRVVMIKSQSHAFMNLSPNPAANTLLASGSFQKGTIELINSGGERVFLRKINTSSVLLDISGLPAGLYLVRFSDAATVINKKLVIQHK